MNAYPYEQLLGNGHYAPQADSRYLRRFGYGDDRVWLYLACAYGHKCSHTHGSRERAEIERKALECLKAVRVRNPEQFDLVESLYDPAREGDGDLVVFYNRAYAADSEGEPRGEFRQILTFMRDWRATSGVHSGAYERVD